MKSDSMSEMVMQGANVAETQDKQPHVMFFSRPVSNTFYLT